MEAFTPQELQAAVASPPLSPTTRCSVDELRCYETPSAVHSLPPSSPVKDAQEFSRCYGPVEDILPVNQSNSGPGDLRCWEDA